MAENEKLHWPENWLAQQDARDAAIGGLVNAAQNLEQWESMGRAVIGDHMKELAKALENFKAVQHG